MHSSHIDNYDETKKILLEFKEWSDSNYNINNHAEDRLSFYLRNRRRVPRRLV